MKMINYRAKIYAMKRLWVESIVSVSACGSLKEEIKPLDFVVPDQFLDRTNRTRQASFFTESIVAHVAFAEPVSKELTDIGNILETHGGPIGAKNLCR